MATKKRRKARKGSRKRAAKCVTRNVCGRRRRLCFAKNGRIVSSDVIGGRKSRKRRRAR